MEASAASRCSRVCIRSRYQSRRLLSQELDQVLDIGEMLLSVRTPILQRHAAIGETIAPRRRKMKQIDSIASFHFPS